MRNRWLLLVVPLLAAVAGPAHAALIELSWSGTITAAEIGGVSVGDPASGSFLIDTDTPDEDADPGRGEYPGALGAISFSFGSYTGTGGGNVLVIRDGPDPGFPDNFTLVASAIGSDLDGVPVSDFIFDLSDPTLAAFSSDAIPEALDLEDFSGRLALLTFFDGEESFGLQSSITSLTYTLVPEPGSAALLGLGALALAARHALSRPKTVK